MSKPLPARPDLEQLRKQAKDLLKSAHAGQPDALRRFWEHHPEHSPSAPSLADAQLVLAREHGFASWPKLKEHIHAVLLDTRDPLELFKDAFHADDAVLFAKLLERYPVPTTPRLAARLARRTIQTSIGQSFSFPARQNGVLSCRSLRCAARPLDAPDLKNRIRQSVCVDKSTADCLARADYTFILENWYRESRNPQKKVSTSEACCRTLRKIA